MGSSWETRMINMRDPCLGKELKVAIGSFKQAHAQGGTKMKKTKKRKPVKLPTIKTR